MSTLPAPRPSDKKRLRRLLHEEFDAVIDQAFDAAGQPVPLVLRAGVPIPAPPREEAFLLGDVTGTVRIAVAVENPPPGGP